MKKTSKILIFFGSILAVYLIYKLIPAFIFLFVMITDPEGRLNNQKLISDMVIENQDILNEIAEKILISDKDLDIYIDEKGMTVIRGDAQILSDSNEDIDWLFHEKYVEEIRVYVRHDIQVMLFQTSSTGIVGSGKVLGFCYLEKGEREDIFGEKSLFPGKEVSYEEILPKWFYYKYTE